MKRGEAIALLGISANRFNELVRASHLVKDGTGNHHDYTDEDLRIIKRVLVAAKELKEAKFELNEGRATTASKYGPNSYDKFLQKKRK